MARTGSTTQLVIGKSEIVVPFINEIFSNRWLIRK